MTYHLARDGQQLGTCSQDEATARYARGEILPTDLVWTEGMAEWLPAAKVFGGPASTPTPPSLGAPVISPPPAASSVGGAAVPPKKPENFLVFAILSTVLCCLPPGIVAIVYAAQVDGKYSKGDYAGAEQSAKNARLWTWIAVGVGLVGGLAWGVMVAISAASGGPY